MARIVMATFGSYGDLHPYMAIGIELSKRGHQVVIATSATYEAKVKSEGLNFHPVRPDAPLTDRTLLEYIFDRRKGTERILRFLANVVEESYEDTLRAASEADLLVTHQIAFAAVLVAERLRKPWVSSVLAPSSFLSAYDPPVPAPAPWMVKMRVFGPGLMGQLWKLARRETLKWLQPVADLRRKLGLPPGDHPLFDGAHSPSLGLALFSRHLTEPQRDWPEHTLVTGFPFFDRHHEQQQTPAELKSFLEAGPAPVVFTLGSSAVGAAGSFYRDSWKAIESLGARAMFLTGPHPQGLPEKMAGALVLEYAPHSEVFPKAAAIVHQGGIGTTAQAMRSGRPMLVVPFAHDQPDNAERVRRLGVAEVLPRTQYSASAAAKHIRRLLRDASYAYAAGALGEKVRAENGTVRAADALETLVS